MSKKKTEEQEFMPSKYQEAIFDYIKKGQGHLVIEAAAGSGKTSTLVRALSLIPSDKHILLTAFNNDIVKELAKRTKNFPNVETRTLHGMGLLFLKRNFENKPLEIDEFKYASIIKNNIWDFSSLPYRSLRGRMFYKYRDNVQKYINFGRYYLCQTPKDLDFIEERYDIETIADEKEVAIKIMEWGKSELDTIDYGDMIWLPNALLLKPYGLLYDYILVDECQDMNKAERELILKCFKMGTRLISVGDRNQCIYSFAGSDPHSFEEICSLPNTICLPLSISYRCASKIVEHAKSIVSSIEPNDDGREGKIIHDAPLDIVEDGDMILCRNNAPLLQVYNTYLKMGRKAYIRGKDIGSNLKTIVRSTKQSDLNVDRRADGVFARLYDDLFSTRNKLMDSFHIDSETALKCRQIQNKLDNIKALEILAEGINTSDELIGKIDEIFPKKSKKEGIALSTVHKAKGLEANNVYIVCNSLMPSKSAKQDWEIRQEYNLMYVAYTRARNTLGFIDEKGFEDFDTSSSNSIKKLKTIETQVNQVLGKSTKVIMNEDNVKRIINNAEKIDKNILTSSTINLATSPNTRKVNAFADFLKNKKKRNFK